MDGRLTPQKLAFAIQAFSAADADLARVIDTYGLPPLFTHEKGFPTLIKLILEQQVSLESAQAAFDRLKQAVDTLTPDSFLTLSDEALRKIGFSRQKTRYGRILSEAVLKGELNLTTLETLSEDAARNKLVTLKGIGPWTANIYLMMALHHQDIWPVGDRALVVAVKEVKGLERDPSRQELLEIGEMWRPMRSAATHIFWHYYLSRKGFYKRLNG